MVKNLRKEMTVNIMFKPSRVKDVNLADAYEKILPSKKESLRSVKDQVFLDHDYLFYFKQEGASS